MALDENDALLAQLQSAVTQARHNLVNPPAVLVTSRIFEELVPHVRHTQVEPQVETHASLEDGSAEAWEARHVFCHRLDSRMQGMEQLIGLFDRCQHQDCGIISTKLTRVK